jgi:hypothetical protein
VLALGVLAVVAALAWLAEHLAVLAGCGILIGGAYYLGQLHERRRARPAITSRPGQARPEEPAAAAALPVATLPLAGDWDELGTRQQPASQQAGPDRDSLIAAPMSGAHPLSPLWRSS